MTGVRAGPGPVDCDDDREERQAGDYRASESVETRASTADRPPDRPGGENGSRQDSGLVAGHEHGGGRNCKNQIAPAPRARLPEEHGHENGQRCRQNELVDAEEPGRSTREPRDHCDCGADEPVLRARTIASDHATAGTRKCPTPSSIESACVSVTPARTATTTAAWCSHAPRIRSSRPQTSSLASTRTSCHEPSAASASDCDAIRQAAPTSSPDTARTALQGMGRLSIGRKYRRR